MCALKVSRAQTENACTQRPVPTANHQCTLRAAAVGKIATKHAPGVRSALRQRRPARSISLLIVRPRSRWQRTNRANAAPLLAVPIAKPVTLRITSAGELPALRPAKSRHIANAHTKWVPLTGRQLASPAKRAKTQDASGLPALRPAKPRLAALAPKATFQTLARRVRRARTEHATRSQSARAGRSRPRGAAA